MATATTLSADPALSPGPTVDPNANATSNPGPGSRNTSSDSSRFDEVTNAKKPSTLTAQNRKKSKKSPSTAAPDRTANPSRWKTFAASFKELYNLPPEDVSSFLSSYQIYNLDWADPATMTATLGPEYPARVGECLRAYYKVMHLLCSLGDVECMYIPPTMDPRRSVRDNQLLYEEQITRDLGLKPGMRVLDLGCGRGRVAAHVATYAGVRVTGLNIDPDQIAQAREYEETEMQGKTLGNEFVVHDQNVLPLPFEDNQFDGFYEIQALSLCMEPEALFREVYRVLKPGARFSLLDWVSLPAYDGQDEEQAELMRRVKPLIGAVGTPTPASFERDLRKAGFKVTKSDIPSVDGLQAELIDKVDVYFRSLRKMIHGLVRVKALPPHFRVLFDRLCLDGQAFVEMDKRRLVTTTYRIVAEKPAAGEDTAEDGAAAEQ